jgi:hypothetical protein
MGGTKLEFVGGPLDGRRDIETPTDADRWLYQAVAPGHCAMAPCAESAMVETYQLRSHVYRFGYMRKTGPEWSGKVGYWQEIVWDVWLYEGT